LRTIGNLGIRIIMGSFQQACLQISGIDATQLPIIRKGIDRYRASAALLARRFKSNPSIATKQTKAPEDANQLRGRLY
jgi:hypothetical protein